MTSVIPARRRAEEFAAVVDGRAGDARYADLLDVVTTMRTATAPEPRPEFVSALRAELMAEADVALASIDRRLSLAPTTHSRRDRRLAIAAGAITLVGATSSVAVASQGALPGDALYPVKRVLESASTSLQVEDSERAARLMDQASGRLDEVSALAHRDNAEARAALPATLDDFVAQANKAADLKLAAYDESGDAQHVEELRSFVQSSVDELSALDGIIPAELLGNLDEAAAALLAIDVRALEACPSCGAPIQLPNVLSASSLSGNPVLPGLGELPQLGDQPATVDGSSDALQQLIEKLPVVPEQDGNNRKGESTPTLNPQVPGEDGGSTDLPTLKDVTDPLLGGEGPLAPLKPITDPLLDPLIGDDGLLSP